MDIAKERQRKEAKSINDWTHYSPDSTTDIDNDDLCKFSNE